MPSPRSLLFLASYLLPLITPASSLHTSDRYQKRNATGSTTYFGVSSAEHEEKSTALKSSGYRPLSLSLYGSPSDLKYAAVWTPNEGALPFETIHSANKTTFDSWIESWKARGYVSTQVSAIGPAENASYAGVMEQREVSNWIQECDLDNPFALQNITGGQFDLLMKAVSMYGTPENPRYCLLAYENTEHERQYAYYPSTTFSYNYTEAYTTQLLNRYWRPIFLDVFVDGRISSLFGDTTIGKWASEVDLSESQLVSQIKEQDKNGLSPILLQGGGSPSNIRYAVIFAERTSPVPRSWSASGAVTGFVDNEGTTTAFDNVMQSFMKANGVRQAQVAVAINGTVIAERAYTWAEPDRAVVQPNDKFLLASVSKMFCHAAVHSLITSGLLNTSTLVFPLLGITPADSRANDITVEHLLFHRAGYDRDMSIDLGVIFTLVAQSNNSSSPATLRDVIDWVAARPLDFTPGAREAYSNFGTMLLSYVITNLTGLAYEDYLRENVLHDEYDADLYATEGSKHVADSIVQETAFVGTDALHPASSAQVPAIYGGDGAIKEEAIGAYGLRASASTIARFIGKHAIWGIGDREPYANRDGTLAGARTYSSSMEKVDWALTLNTREYTSEGAWNLLTWSNLPDLLYNFPTV